jgi:hypothetical protein
MSVELQLPSEPALSTRNAQAANTAHSCPSCGTPVAVEFEGADEATRVVRELQAQMEVLREKVAAAGMSTRLTSSHYLLQHAYGLGRKQMCRLREPNPYNEDNAAAQHQPAHTQQHLGLCQYLLSRQPPFDSDADARQITVSILFPHRETDIACKLGGCTSLAFFCPQSVSRPRPFT